jgi:hypothetical protein
MELKPKELSDDVGKEHVLGEWYVNLLWMRGKKCLQFTHEPPAFSFLMTSVARKDIRDIGPLFEAGAVAALADEGIDTSFLFALRRDCRSVQVATTKNRRVLGSMNEQAFVSGLWIEGSPTETVDLARYFNRTILGVIDSCKSIACMRDFAFAE